MLSEFNVTINFFELFAKKFAKTGKNRLFDDKKTLKSTLYKAFLRVLVSNWHHIYLYDRTNFKKFQF